MRKKDGDDKSSIVDTYTEKFPEGGKYFGFENISATMCYANSSL